jgi:alpha-tubulin suppressor-like RCC1 family protein
MRRMLAAMALVALAACGEGPTAPGTPRVGSIAAGGNSSCALLQDGSLQCWGTIDTSTVPEPAPGALEVRTVALGNGPVDAACVTSAGAATYCWGDYAVNWEQYTSYGAAPVLLQDSLRFEHLAMGDGHACGLADGSAYCWGSYAGGKRGTGEPIAPPADGNTLLNRVAGGLSFVDLTASRTHTCGLTAAGEVFCWGLGPWLGDTGGPRYSTMDECSFYQFETTCALTPVKVTALSGVRAISAGSFGSCALGQDGAVRCWGADDGVSPPATGLPTAVPLPEAATQVSVGGRACALGASGTAYCWARGGSPETVPTDLRFESLSAGEAHTCGVSVEQVAYCWGENRSGQLGDGTVTASEQPVEVQLQPS